MHGYELRKRLNTALGAFRALSYGSLYPCLRDLLGKGWIFEASGGGSDVLSGSRRARIVYELTADGKERFQDMAESAGPTSGEREPAAGVASEAVSVGRTSSGPVSGFSQGCSAVASCPPGSRPVKIR